MCNSWYLVADGSSICYYDHKPSPDECSANILQHFSRRLVTPDRPAPLCFIGRVGTSDFEPVSFAFPSDYFYGGHYV